MLRTDKRQNKIKQIFYFFCYLIKSRLSNRQKNPLICSFKITDKCNLKCRHCPFWRENNSLGRGDLTFSEVTSILDSLYENGVRIVIFEGGEPMLWNDLKAGKTLIDILGYAKKKFFAVGLTTNGTFDIEDIEPDIVFISIDGLQQTHDKIRGKSFDRIIQNINKNHMNKKIIANICISKYNSEDISELIKYLNDKVFGVTIQFFYPYTVTKDLRLTPIEKRLLLNKLISMKKDGFKILDSKPCLKSMADNSWNCHPFLVSSVDHLGNISNGCYLKNKAENVSCKDCGFAVHCEISYAYTLNIRAIMTAAKIFW